MGVLWGQIQDIFIYELLFSELIKWQWGKLLSFHLNCNEKRYIGTEGETTFLFITKILRGIRNRVNTYVFFHNAIYFYQQELAIYFFYLKKESSKV